MVSQTKYLTLINKYSPYIAAPPILDLDLDSATGVTKVRLNLEFIPHPVYGKTKFRIRERYDSSGNLFFYRYCWEINKRPTGHITAWENEHNHGLPTDPHHHHHVPFDRKQVQANPNVRTLEDAFNVIIPYIVSGKPYP